MKWKKIIYSALAIAALGACTKVGDKFDSRLNDPNFPLPNEANADLYLTNIQFGLTGLFSTASAFGGQITRMENFSGATYLNGYTPVSYDGIWRIAYTNIFKNANALIPIAEGQKKFINVGMAKFIKAYTMITLVDMFGDVPYTEANQSNTNTNPKADKGEAVYAAAIKLLDEAIADFSKVPASYPGPQDLFYNSVAPGAGQTLSAGAIRWRTAAKTLKLRAFMQTRLVDATAKAKIDALLTENDLIDTPAEDFEFKYSNKQSNPNSRHPNYNANYSSTGSAGSYISTYYAWTLVQEKGNFSNNPANDRSDPRTRYYFYRQRTNFADLNQNTASCSSDLLQGIIPSHWPAGTPFCVLINGFWTRDHGDNSGTPPDGPLRTTYGIYPAGGEFDAGQGTSVSLNRGAQGAGILPIWQSSFTDFLKAEGALKLGTAGTTRTLLESAVRKSLDKVIGYPTSVSVIISNPAFIPDQAKKDAYVTKVLALYDAATTDDQRLNVIMKEYYIALWGNGLDIYNNYRRTGKPDNMQPTINAAPGEFIRSNLYPSDYVNLNQNAIQKSNVGVRVFWDNNPAGFIK
jgi:hypothetical protein